MSTPYSRAFSAFNRANYLHAEAKRDGKVTYFLEAQRRLARARLDYLGALARDARLVPHGRCQRKFTVDKMRIVSTMEAYRTEEMRCLLLSVRLKRPEMRQPIPAYSE